MKAGVSFKQILLLQAIIIIYTVSGIMVKFASQGETISELLFYFAMGLFFLGIYALCWQQIIKRFPLSVAYTNRAMALLWSALWASIIFNEKIDGGQLAGLALVIVGILIINTDRGEKIK